MKVISTILYQLKFSVAIGVSPNLIVTRFKILFAIVWIALFANGQHASIPYYPVSCTGQIPSDFLYTLADNYTKSNNDKLLNEYKQKSMYAQVQYLQSGEVIFNDTISRYCSKVLDKVLASKPELRKQLRIYLSTEPQLNASAFDNGVILVNTGLLPYLKSEDELAMVLSHEVGHYLKQHGLTLYGSYKQVDKKYRKKELEGYDHNQMVLKKSRHSQVAEYEADSVGFDLLLSSSYNVYEALRIYDWFSYAHLPVDTVGFDKSFFESGYFTLPASYWINNVGPIQGADYIREKLYQRDRQKANEMNQIVKERLETHPGSHLRKSKLEEKLGKLGGKQFQKSITEGEFLAIKEYSKFEMVRQLLLHSYPEEAFYQSVVMLQHYPGNKFLEKLSAKALVSLSIHFNSGMYSKVHREAFSSEGNFKQLTFLFENMASYQQSITILAARYVYGLLTKYPEDNELRSMCLGLLEDISFRFGYGLKDFYSSAEFEKLLASLNLTFEEYRNTPEVVKRDDVPLYMFTAFEGFVEDTNFRSLFEEAELLAQEKDRQYTVRGTRSAKVNNRISAESLIMLNPHFASYNMKMRESKNFVKTEKLRNKSFDFIRKAGSKSGISLVMLESRNLNPQDIEQFNDISILNRFLMQRYHLSKDASIMSIYKQELQPVMNKYNSRYVALTSVVHLVPNPAWALLGTVALITVPFSAPAIFKAAFTNTYYYSEVIDMETGVVAAKFDGYCLNTQLANRLEREFRNLKRTPVN